MFWMAWSTICLSSDDGPPNVTGVSCTRMSQLTIAAAIARGSVKRLLTQQDRRYKSSAVETLIVALKDSDWNVRQAAPGALGQIGDATAVEPLVHILGEEELQLRVAAVQARLPRPLRVASTLLAFAGHVATMTGTTSSASVAPPWKNPSEP